MDNHRVVRTHFQSYGLIELVEEPSTSGIDLATPEKKKKAPAGRPGGFLETAFGSPRDFLDNRFVYAVVSARARGLAIGINLCPDKLCNFFCIYCEVHRNGEPRQTLDIDLMAAELRKTLGFIHGGRLRERPWYHGLPDELLKLRHVAITGDGEPTLCPRFQEALQAIMHVRALGDLPFFKLVLMTNGSGLDLPHVQDGLKHFTRTDEIWVKLDGGTQAYLNRVNRAEVPLEKILSNILVLGRTRPVVIQSLFPALNGEDPPLQEIEQYAQRLLELKSSGCEIAQVQIYSATRPSQNASSGHLPLKVLSRIAQTVRKISGLKAEVY